MITDETHCRTFAVAYARGALGLSDDEALDRGLECHGFKRSHVLGRIIVVVTR